jgi:hypothetical protein
MPDFKTFFDEYAAAFNRSLGDKVDADAIMAAFADCFVGAGPSGVICGHNGKPFRDALENGYAFYKDVGTKRMSVRGLDVTAIDDDHHMVAVHWRAEYERKDGSPVAIDFDVTYMLQTLPGEASKIFAYVSGDEMAALKAHGLLERTQHI